MRALLLSALGTVVLAVAPFGGRPIDCARVTRVRRFRSRVWPRRRHWIMICLAFAAPSVMSAQTTPAPDIRTLMAQLSDVRTIGPDTVKQILELARKDPDARQYVVQKLPGMIDKPETDEVWLNAVRLAGQLKAAEAVPSLQKALSRGRLGGPLNTTFTTQIRLDDDVVAKALSEIGDPAVPAVADFLKSREPKTRRRAVLILRNIGSPTSRKILGDHLQHESDPNIKDVIENSLRSKAPD